MWHCPHCGTPQTETARCWVCRRSSTTCSTCRHFRTSLAADVGYCAKDRWRTPLTGLELRACWEEGRRPAMTVPVGPGGPEAADAEPARRETASVRGDGGPQDRPNPMRLRGFIPVEELQAAEVAREATPRRRPRGGALPASDDSLVPSPPPVVADTLGGVDDWEKRVSLFGEAEG